MIKSARTLALVAAACAALPLSAALAQQPMQEPASVASRNFVLAANQADEFEIAEGETASIAAHDPQVRAFAVEMIREHQSTRQSMQQAAQKGGVALPPPGMGTDHAAMLGALQSQRDTEFDKTYAKQQVMAHREALAVQEGYIRDGTDPALKAAAAATTSLIRRHLAMAEQLKARLGGDS